MSPSASPQIVLITGCSSGFGLLTAARLAARGHQVIATMRDLKKSGPLMEEVERRGGGKLELLPLDVTRADTVRLAVAEIGSRYGYVDVLVNNAGFGLGGCFEDLTDDEIRRQFEVNFFGVLNVTRAIIPLMRAKRRGRIINISSMAGFSGSPCFGAYNASKWALEGFSESLRYELGFFGIDVFLIEPGTYKTKIFYENAKYAKNFHNDHSPYHPLSRFLERRVREYVDDCHKDPDEIAALVERLMLSRNPPFRSIPDIESQVVYLLRRILPFRLYSAIYRRVAFRGFRFPE